LRRGRSDVGMVKCCIVGPATTVGSRLEALGIGQLTVWPGVMSARMIEGRTAFGLGSTRAFRRSDLQGSAGLKVVDIWRTDYERAIDRASGKANRAHASSGESFFPPIVPGVCRSQLRWGTRVGPRGVGVTHGLIIDFGLPWATLAIMAGEKRSGLVAVVGRSRHALGRTHGGGRADETQTLRIFHSPLAT